MQNSNMNYNFASASTNTGNSLLYFLLRECNIREKDKNIKREREKNIIKISHMLPNSSKLFNSLVSHVCPPILFEEIIFPFLFL